MEVQMLGIYFLIAWGFYCNHTKVKMKAYRYLFHFKNKALIKYKIGKKTIETPSGVTGTLLKDKYSSYIAKVSQTSTYINFHGLIFGYKWNSKLSLEIWCLKNWEDSFFC